MPSCKISWLKNFSKKGKNLFLPKLQFVSLGKMARKAEPFSYWENLLLFWMMLNQGRYIRRETIFIFSFCLGLVTQLNGSASGVLKHHYITKRIRELLIGNSRFLIYNLLN